MNNAPPPDAPPPARALARRVAPVRAAAPGRDRDAAMERTRVRLVWAAGGFAVLFLAVAAKLADATAIDPMRPHRVERVTRVPEPRPDGSGTQTAMPAGPHMRATITDRNGEILAVSLPTAALYANPKEMIDPAEAAHRLKSVLPRLDEAVARTRLGSDKQFVYLERQITPREQVAINDLGIPGVYFQPTERRRYPLGRVAAQVLGGVDVDGRGVAGAERFFDARLHDDAQPLRLSVDVRVQGVVRDELKKAMDEFSAIGACGIVMDVRTGEVVAMVSLPDYDANEFGEAAPEQRFNRAVTGMYEPGSTFKLQTASMALDRGLVHIWDQFDAAHDIHIGRFTISDFEGKHRFLYLPEVLAYSSNLGAAHIASIVGGERQREWLRGMGMFSRIGVELPEAAMPIIPSESNWKDVVTMTVGFGHGIAVSPLHVVRGTAAVANGGVVLRPTILDQEAGTPVLQGTQVMQPATSALMRRLMRLVVTNGFGKPADVAGYFVGGKTGTAEKSGAHGYKKHANISAFMSVFPMNAPRYAVYMMLDEPHGNKETGYYSTAGAVSAPAAGRVIARIGPMLGVFPETANAAAVQASLDIPLQPARGTVLHGAPVAETHPKHEPAPRPAAPRIEARDPAALRREVRLTQPAP